MSDRMIDTFVVSKPSRAREVDRLLDQYEAACARVAELFLVGDDESAFLRAEELRDDLRAGIRAQLLPALPGGGEPTP